MVNLDSNLFVSSHNGLMCRIKSAGIWIKFVCSVKIYEYFNIIFIHVSFFQVGNVGCSYISL
jgi:hypothetical protein